MLQRAVTYLTDPPAQSVLPALPAGVPAPLPPVGLDIPPESALDQDCSPGGVRAAAGDGSEGASRPGEPPVGSQRRPGTRSTSSRSTGRSSTSRRQTRAGEADE